MSALTDVAEADELVLRSARGRVALVATVAACAMASLDATVVNVALPHIGEEFDATVSALQWVTQARCPLRADGLTASDLQCKVERVTGIEPA